VHLSGLSAVCFRFRRCTVSWFSSKRNSKHLRMNTEAQEVPVTRHHHIAVP